MATGKIKTWKGQFGFIIDDTGGPDVYFNIGQVNHSDRKSLSANLAVEFEKGPSSKFPDDSTKFEAYKVRLQTTIPESHDEMHSSDYFHNPYTFIPTPPRPCNGFAGDFNPLVQGLDHASLKDDLWTGHIPIKLTAVTPLVLLKDDGRKRDSTKPQTYDVHSRIPESSLRGMLRSAYEVVTNSRYSCFRNKDRLAYRMDTGEATKLIPAIINDGKVCLYPGTSHVTSKGPSGIGKKGVPYAAMLSLYSDDNLNALHDVNYTPKTGDEVWAEILLCQHEVSNSGKKNWTQDFLFWKVIKIWKTSTRPNKPSKTGESIFPQNRRNTNPKFRQSYFSPIEPEVRKMVKGYVMITNKNMRNKHDERIFFNLYSEEFEVTEKLKEAWRMRIQSYRNAHSDSDFFNRTDMYKKSKKPWEELQKNSKTKEYAWSPHQYQDSNHRNIWQGDPHVRSTTHDAIELKDGDMAYARCEIDDTTGTITDVKDIFPVMISRELYENSPEGLLDQSLRPATELEKLSPADRLFGWAPQGQGSDGGYKSRIRVVCEDSECPTILEDFENKPLPLTILGQPKPEQGRFYVAADRDGTPQDGVSKQDAGYDKNGKKQLRGRKHYWHHKGLEAVKGKAEDYWDPSDPSKDQKREYIRTGRKEDTQNRSIKGWIEPGNEFEATLYVQNLQPEEVGALLWLLTLNDNLGEGDDKRYFKLGYGKPLGFGSVKIEIDKKRLEDGCLPLASGNGWKSYYADLNDSPPAKRDDKLQETFIQQFISSMVKVYDPPKENQAIDDGDNDKSLSNPSLSDQLKSIQENTLEGQEYLKKRAFDNLPFIKGFLRVLQGPNKDIPIHYPRTNPKRHPDGKNFEWFMDNENGRSPKVAKRTEVGKQLALPDVTKDKGLPYVPSNPKPKK